MRIRHSEMTVFLLISICLNFMVELAWANQPPSAPTIAIEPTTPTTVDVLSAVIVVDSVDPDGDAVSYEYAWTINSVWVGSGPTLAPGLFFTDDVIDLWVTPNDGWVEGAAASDQVTIQNAPPSQPVVAIVPLNPSETDDLLCTIVEFSTDPDGDLVSYDYTWYVDGMWFPAFGDMIDAANTYDGETWECFVTPNDGNDFGLGGSALVQIGGLSVVPGSGQGHCGLIGANPNPFNPSTTLSFEISEAANVRLCVYDTAGRLVVVLANGLFEVGHHEVLWDGRDSTGRMSSTGVYLYRLESGAYNETKRVVLVK